MTVGTHGTTFGGNPLAMAVGNAVLDVVLAPGFLDHVQRVGPRAEAAPRGAQGPPSGGDRRDPRAGADDGPAAPTCRTRISSPPRADQKLILIAAGDNVARLLPPLIVTEEDDRRGGPAASTRPAPRIEAELKGIAQRGAAE